MAVNNISYIIFPLSAIIEKGYTTKMIPFFFCSVYHQDMLASFIKYDIESGIVLLLYQLCILFSFGSPSCEPTNLPPPWGPGGLSRECVLLIIMRVVKGD